MSSSNHASINMSRQQVCVLAIFESSMWQLTEKNVKFLTKLDIL